MKKYNTWIVWGGIAAVGLYLYMKNRKSPVTVDDLTNKANAGKDKSVAPKPPVNPRRIVSTEVNFTGVSHPRSKKKSDKFYDGMNIEDFTSIGSACRCSDKTYTKPNDVPNIIY